MVITLWGNQKTKIANLPELLEKVRLHGGAIVQYQRIFAILLYTQWYSKFEWVPPGRSRTSAGIKHAIFCLLLGWWSIYGWIFTPAMAVNNFMGGIDVTKQLVPQPPALPGQTRDDSADHEHNQALKRQQYISLAVFATMLILLIVFSVIPAIKKYG